MAAISDAVVIGLVLTLVFAAVSYYLYSQIGQLTHKVGLMENILLDLKVATEQAVMAGNEHGGFSTDDDLHFHSQPAQLIPPTPPRSVTASPVNEVVDNGDLNSAELSSGPTRELFVESRARADHSGAQIQVERLGSPPTEQPSVSVNYEAMTYKELTAIARQKNIHGLRSMTKAQVIEALRGGAGSSVEVKKEGAASLSNWTSSGTVSFSDELGGAEDHGADAGGILSLDDTNLPEVNLVSSD
jgi:hypothetical protein